MEDEEFEKARKFLDDKKIPTSDDILKLFFNEIEDVIMMSDEQFHEVDFESLGEADDIKTISGTEWIASRLIWNTPDGPICNINLIKIGSINLKDPYEMNGLYNKRNFPFGNETIDIDYEDIVPLPFTEQLSLAIEVEDFEEAARLRDWDAGFKKLLLELKPKIIEAINKHNVTALDEYLTEIRAYRATL